jgi:demethylmenaquinone methyltransferase/2-methoxy-6-polyprenyl-1,4-benzoquinol methylase
MTGPVRDTLIPAEDNRRMFDRIARRYDLLNAIMSFGLHRFWRRKALESLYSTGCARGSHHYMDLGCGTGDVAIAILKSDPSARITGIDLSAGMIKIAERKTRAAGLQSRATYQIGDATALAFGEKTFDGIVSAFCVRNIEDRAKAFREMKRVLRPGGTVVILELTRPTAPVPRLVHLFHTHWVIPLLGSLLSQRSAYRYLADSIEHFPPPAAIVAEMTTAGLRPGSPIPLSGGLVTLFTARAPGPYTFAAPEYANSVPLAHFIPEVSPGSRVVLNTPSQLLAPLVNGEIDAALIPVAALFANPSLMALEGTGICAGKKVRSVLLRCKRPLEQIRTITLDPASRTSNALAQVLLKTHWKRAIQTGVNADEADAAVVIGDRALCEKPGPGGDYDLATAWNQMTGLPFVFAVWAVRRDHPDPAGLTGVIQAAKQAGVAAIPKIAQEQAVKLGLSEATCLEYFTGCIYYDIGPREREAMELFRKMLAELS